MTPEKKAKKRVYDMAYRARNRERIAAWRREHRPVRTDESRRRAAAYTQLYRDRHPDRIKAQWARSREKNKDRIREQRKVYRAKPESLAKARAAAKAWRDSHRDSVKRHRHRGGLRMYGLSEEQYGEILVQQGGGCAICGRAEKDSSRRRLCVDHDHTTGEVRGLLCGICNRHLGLYETNHAKFEAYLAEVEASKRRKA